MNGLGSNRVGWASCLIDDLVLADDRSEIMMYVTVRKKTQQRDLLWSGEVETCRE